MGLTEPKKLSLAGCSVEHVRITSFTPKSPVHERLLCFCFRWTDVVVLEEPESLSSEESASEDEMSLDKSCAALDSEEKVSSLRRSIDRFTNLEYVVRRLLVKFEACCQG
jgi:hypothetical protein